MGLREDYFRRIEKKRAEVEAMRVALKGEERYLEAMLDTYKLLPRSGEEANGSSSTGFRKGSFPAKAHEVLTRVGHPMHVKDLVEAMGLKPSRSTTQGVSSSLRAYVNNNHIFSKPAPNTYGLLTFGEADSSGSLLDATEH